MAKVADFLESIATTELKCAQLLNKVEEFDMDQLFANELSPGMLSFL